MEIREKQHFRQHVTYKFNPRFIKRFPKFDRSFIARTILSVGLFVFIVFLSFGHIQALRAQGTKLVREPNAINFQNSQTIDLLKGHLNLNQNAIFGRQLAVVDNSALESDTSLLGTDNFSDPGLGGSGEISTYIVRQGDTLSTIAKMFQVSVNTIIWANNIKNGVISPGQSLVILPISGVEHTVAKGDTVQSIAKKYHADVQDILAFNGFSSTDVKLVIGDIVIVPDGEISSTSTSGLRSAGATLVDDTGYFIRPVRGGVKTQGLHGHNAVDLGGLPIGSPIYAAADGNVIVAKSGGWNGGYGSYVVIAHANGTQTLYAHMSQVIAKVGDKVSQGDVIGKLGNTGLVTGPHLHFEVRGARNPF